MKTKLCLLILVMLTSCSKHTSRDSNSESAKSPQNTISTLVVEYNSLEKRSNILYQIGSQIPFTGMAVERHPNGTVAARFSYRNGISHGPAAMFYEDGNRESEALMEDGIVNGKITRWFKNGNLKSETPYLKGRMSGLKVEYWENGNRRHEETYVDGRLDGPAADYDETGKQYQHYSQKN